MQVEPKLMTLTTAAIRYAVSRRTVERWIREGRLQKFKIGSPARLLIKESDDAIFGRTAPQKATAARSV